MDEPIVWRVFSGSGVSCLVGIGKSAFGSYICSCCSGRWLLCVASTLFTPHSEGKTPAVCDHAYAYHFIPVEECKGFLLRVFRFSEKNEWEPTALDEPLELIWSVYDDTGPRTLYPGVASRLNVCYVSSHDRGLHVSVAKLPLRCAEALKARNPNEGHDTFRFDVRLASKMVHLWIPV
jgi:hypothetical protein